jgi:hypothetical protein
MNNVDFDISNVSFETEGEVGDIKYRFHFFYTDPKTQKKKRIRFSFFLNFLVLGYFFYSKLKSMTFLCIILEKVKMQKS